MFMSGPFMRYPFMDSGRLAADSRMTAVSNTDTSFVSSSSWDALLEEDNSPMIYMAVIEPWVLADRS